MQRVLRDGLILRTLSEGFESDSTNLPAFYAEVNGEGDPPPIRAGLERWTEDLIERHPAMTLDDFFVVVDPAQGDRIASATLNIPQRWSYEGIPFGVGRPELVGTLPDYRRRGLVRELINEVHKRSEAMGDLAQGITGIPHYYRQFGYTMAIELEAPSFYPLTMLQEPTEEKPRRHTLRPLTVDDLPEFQRCYEVYQRQFLATDVYSAEAFRYQLDGVSPDSVRAIHMFCIVNEQERTVGYIDLWGAVFRENIIECGLWILNDESSYLATFNDVLLGIRDWTREKREGKPTTVQFMQGTPQPVRRLIERTTGGVIRPSIYAWYLRVPDAVAFLRHIGPALEKRLEGSGAHRYTGALKIGFYDMTGIALNFADGKLTDVAKIEGKDGYDISFPWHLLWNVVFGHNSWEEMRPLLPEVYCDGKTALLMETLFPKRPSWVRGLA